MVFHYKRDLLFLGENRRPLSGTLTIFLHFSIFTNSFAFLNLCMCAQTGAPHAYDWKLVRRAGLCVWFLCILLFIAWRYSIYSLLVSLLFVPYSVSGEITKTFGEN